jgi:hypothetical protein
MKNILLFLITLFISLPLFVVNAQLIQSTPAGGNWQDGSTWQGGIMPDSTNDVIINGDVTNSPAAVIVKILLSFLEQFFEKVEVAF